MDRKGFLSATVAFLIWGLVPIFWKQLQHISSLELIMHRVVWSALLCFLILLAQKRGQQFKNIYKNKKMLLTLLLSTLLVSTNWFIFIWAVNQNHVLETSLGYYILPLLNVLMGSFILKEKISKMQKWAILLCSVGVINLAVSFGHFPWISLSLALSFGLYGLVRKMAPIDSIMGLTYEAFILFIPAAIYLVFIHSQNEGHFGFNTFDSVMLFFCGVITLVPLFFYLIGLRRLKLTTMGFLQFIVPTTTFLLAVYVYKEPFDQTKLITFVFIWISVIMYLSDLKFRNSSS